MKYLHSLSLSTKIKSVNKLSKYTQSNAFIDVTITIDYSISVLFIIYYYT